DSTRLVHFFKDEASDKPTRLAGGHVHVLDENGILKFVTRDKDDDEHGGVVYAESECPHCEMWLHISIGFPPGGETAPHYHLSDEILYITEGSMIFGRTEVRAG